jgi:protein involved in polysaccharide export with SLBB domain
MTPLEAISQGGGVNDFADTNDIFIIRRIDGKQHNLPYNYDKALKGEDPDVDFQLEAGDIIFIP